MAGTVATEVAIDVRNIQPNVDRKWFAGLVALDVAIVLVLWHGVFRPFWYDEGWRAYHITLTSGWWSALRGANAPMAAGWLGIERGIASLFGNVEWALRLPSILALPIFSIATYRLARWWLAPGWAGATALIASANASLLEYGLQLKAYLPEAACTSVILYAWLAARARREQQRRVWPMYLVIAICVLISLPALFVVGPLLLIDGVTLLRRRDWFGLAAPIAVGVIALAHFQFFVARQSYLVHNNFWSDLTLQGDSSQIVQRLWTAVVSLPSGFGTAAITAPDGHAGSIFRGTALILPPVTPLHVLIGVGLVLAWACGVVACLRRRDGWVLLAVLGGAIALVTFAAARHEWPIGFVRGEPVPGRAALHPGRNRAPRLLPAGPTLRCRHGARCRRIGRVLRPRACRDFGMAVGAGAHRRVQPDPARQHAHGGRYRT